MSGFARILISLGTEKKESKACQGEHHFARRNYLEKVLGYELLPLMITPLTPVGEAIRLLDECAGLYLLGGGDIDAAHYGPENHKTNSLVIPERDAMEIALTQHALANNIPVLGICRGCQMMAVAAGGSLIQHIPDTGTDIIHAPSRDQTEQEWGSTVNHTISVIPDTRTATLLGPTSEHSPLEINSAHHQAIQMLPECFIISAKAPDGIIEIIEHKDSSYFAFGIQSHPEVLRSTPLEAIFKEFAKVCRSR